MLHTNETEDAGDDGGSLRLDLLENSQSILQLVGGRPNGRVAEDRLEGSERGLELCQLSEKGIGSRGNTGD